MAINTTATVSSDIVFQQQDSEDNSFDNRQGSIGFSATLTSGIGADYKEIDAVFNLQDYVIASGTTLALNFAEISQPIVGSQFTIAFTGIKSLIIFNQNTGVGQQVAVRTTGDNALSGMFNGGTGNVLIKPEGSYMYSDIYHGLSVGTGANQQRNIYIGNTVDVMPPYGGAGSAYSTGVKVTVIAVGVSGGV